MRIRTKFTFMVGIPIAAGVAIIAFGKMRDIVEAKTAGELEQYDADNAENMGQVVDRVKEAASITGGDALSLEDTFDGYFEEWQQNSRKRGWRTKS